MELFHRTKVSSKLKRFFGLSNVPHTKKQIVLLTVP